MHPLFHLNHSAADLSQPFIRQTNDRHILDLIVGPEEILNLYRVDVLPTADHHVLLPVYQEIKSVGILHGHVSSIEPPILQHLGSGLRIIVVTGHNARAFHTEFPHLTLGDFRPVLIHHLDLPAVARHPDGAHLLNIVYSQVDTARAGGLGQAIVGIILMVGEILPPPPDQGGRDWLGANVHQTPLVQLVVRQLNLSPVQRVQNVLRPRNQKPYHCALLI